MDILRTVFFTAWFLLWAGSLTYYICKRDWKQVKSYAKWFITGALLGLFLDIVKAPEWTFYVLLLLYIVFDSKLKAFKKETL